MQDFLYPLTFTPVFKDYVWGGRNLQTKLGRDIPDGTVAESWEIAGHIKGSSTVRAGTLVGKTLPEVQEQLGESLVGTRNRYALAQKRFPLLIKLLDANRWLSVQVHPDDEYGLAHDDDFGKTEMWVIVEAEPGAEIIYGFKSGVTRESFAAALEQQQVEETLHRLPVQTGDVVFVPAGSIHALGPGIVVAEIQQNSDTTYRLYDWGRPRPIHVEQGLDVLNFAQVEPTALEPKVLEENGLRREGLGNCQYFHAERLYLPAGHEFVGNCSGATYEIWGILSGICNVVWLGEPVNLAAVDWGLLSAEMGEFSIKATSDSVLLRVYTP